MKVAIYTGWFVWVWFIGLFGFYRLVVLGFGSVELSRKHAIGNQPRRNDYYIIVNHVADPISESGMNKMA